MTTTIFNHNGKDYNIRAEQMISKAGKEDDNPIFAAFSKELRGVSVFRDTESDAIEAMKQFIKDYGHLVFGLSEKHNDIENSELYD